MNIYEEIFHGREGATVKGHKWVTRTGTPGHYKYTYDDKDGDQRFSSSNPVRPSTASKFFFVSIPEFLFGVKT